MNWCEFWSGLEMFDGILQLSEIEFSSTGNCRSWPIDSTRVNGRQWHCREPGAACTWRTVPAIPTIGGILLLVPPRSPSDIGLVQSLMLTRPPSIRATGRRKPSSHGLFGTTRECFGRDPTLSGDDG